MYQPKYAPEIQVEFTVIPGQTGSFRQEHIQDEIVLDNVYIYGEPVSEYLFFHLKSTHERQWDREIRGLLAERRAA